MKYKELEVIKKEFFLIGLLQKKAKFECYSDKIFSYYIYDDSCMHEISIINERATFSKKEKVVDLLDLDNTFYLCHSVYAKDNEGLISRMEFRAVDQDGYINDELN